MGAGASAKEVAAKVEESSQAELSAALSGLDPAEKARIVAALANVAPRSAEDLRDEIQQELKQACPLFDQATDALCQLSKADVGELRNLGERTSGILLLARALCILLDKMPKEENADAFWQTASSEILQDPRLLSTMVDWPEKNLDDDRRAKACEAVAKFCHDPEFDPSAMNSTSQAAAAMSKWVRAVVAFGPIALKKKELRHLEDAEEKEKPVEPKKPEEPEVLFELVINALSGDNMLTIPEASSRWTRSDIVAKLVAGGHVLPAGQFYKLSCGDMVMVGGSTMADLSCPKEMVALKLENPHMSALSKAREEIVGCDLRMCSEVRALGRPPNGVLVTFKACCKLWNVPIPGDEKEFWPFVKNEFLKDPQKNMIDRVKNLDPDEQPDERFAAILDSIEDEAFAVERVAKASLLAKFIAQWMHALASYYRAIVTGYSA